MLRLARSLRSTCAAVSSLVLGAAITAPSTGVQHPQPRVIQLDSTARGYTPVLTGPPATATMRSGYVVLAPGDSVGWHSTERYEEVIVVLSGSGRLIFRGGRELALQPHAVAYTPPQTEHDVVCTGTQPLRYLYVVSRAF